MTSKPLRMHVVVVTYNSLRLARDCVLSTVEAVARHPNVAQMTLVDNSPGHADLALLREHLHFPNIRSLAPSGNTGFAGGCNLGAKDIDCEWILLINPDVSLNNAFLGEVGTQLDALPAKVGSVALGLRIGARVSRGIGVGRSGWFHDRSESSSALLIGPSGGAAAIRREAFVEVGGFDEEMFAWGEDVDLALRLRNAGWETATLPLDVDHQGGHSIAGDAFLRARKHELLLANRAKIAVNHYSVPLRCVFKVKYCAVTIARFYPIARHRGPVAYLRLLRWAFWSPKARANRISDLRLRDVW